MISSSAKVLPASCNVNPDSNVVVADELSPFKITPFAFIFCIVFSAVFWKKDDTSPVIFVPMNAPVKE